jgi:hypothetical protein
LQQPPPEAQHPESANADINANSHLGLGMALSLVPLPDNESKEIRLRLLWLAIYYVGRCATGRLCGGASWQGCGRPAIAQLSAIAAANGDACA